MSENKPIQLLYSYRLRWRDLEGLSDVELAALSSVFFCDNEVNSLRRLCLLSMFWVTENDKIHSAAEIQRNMLLRTLTGRLFEFLELYNQISSEGRQSSSIVEIMKTLKKDQRDCRNHPGFRIAQRIRKSQAHHYDFAAIRKLVTKHDPNAVFDFNLTPESGNAFAPFAEALVFNPDPHDRIYHELSKAEAEALVNNWIDWTHVATDLLKALREQLFEKLIIAKNPSLRPQYRTEYLSPDLKVEGTYRLPLFVQASP
ncbi:MAG: hypothetical protein ACRCSU_08950 [Paracoccaceae bacterium]